MTKLPINHLPKTPGVYLFKNGEGKVIYVGKALNIRSRVRSYFRQTAKDFGFKQSLMLPQIETVECINVASEIEALLLEANLIKKYQPKYNSRLKDDKSYLYIKITTSDDFPKVLTARREKLTGIKYFGPFPSAKTVRNTLKSLRRIFPYCNCNFKVCQKKKSCLWCEIGLDAGACLGLISKDDYRRMIKRLILLLEGKKDKLIKELKKEMVLAAKKEGFEKAHYLKKQIEGIEYLTRSTTSPQVYLEDPEYLAKKRQEGLLELKRILGLSNVPVKIECFDISDIHGKEATGSMVVFQKGEPDKSQYRRFKIRLEEKPNDVAMMQEVVRRRSKHPEWPPADLIVVDGGKGQISGVVKVLEEAKVSIPVIGLAKRMEEIIFRLTACVIDKSIIKTKEPKDLRTKELKFEILRLPRDSAALHILQAIRDEAHRFAITYHRKLRLKISLGSKS